MVNFQGRLTDNNGNILSDGLYNVKFRLWTAASGGTNQWEADRVRGASDNRIQVTQGLFNIQFGDTSLGDPALSPTLFSAYPLYLEVELPTPATATCATNGCASFTEGAMTPRQPLASAPYAFSADTIDGLDSIALAQLSAANTFTGANLFAPTAASTVALTVKATTAGSTNALEVFDSGGARQAYFDASGNLNLARTLQATSNNAIDLGASGTAFRTGYFGTSLVTPALNATSAGGTITTNAGTFQRTTSGTFTLDLSNAAATTLAVTNSAAGAASLTVEGNVTVGAFAAATSTPVCSNAGVLATCNSNPSGVTLQQAYAAGNTISTSGSDIAFTLNSSQNFTTTTVAGGTGFTTFALANGTNTTPPAQLVLINNADTNEGPAAGIKVTSSGGTITSAFDASGSGITNALSIGSNKILGTTGVIDFTNFDVLGTGAVTANTYNALTLTGAADGFTVAGGTTSRTLTVTGANITVGSTIQPTAAGTLAVLSNGANTLRLDAGGASGINVGTINANAVTIGNATAATQVQINGGTNAASAIGLTAATNGTIMATTTGTGNIELDTASSVIAQSTTNSTQAFQVQNAAGTSVLNVDTTDTNLITTNPGFETNPLTGWNNLSGGSVARDTTQQYIGFASGKVTAGTTAGGGISANYSLTNAQQYTLSFYAKLDSTSAALTTLQAGYSANGTTGGEADCTLSSATVTASGWNRYSCTFTASSPSGSPYIYIEHNDTTSEVFYIDAVQLETGAVATPYGAGTVALNATISSPTIFKNQSNSVTALQIQTSNNLPLLTVDTVSNNANNLIRQPSFETGTTGWTARTGCTLAQVNTQQLNGSNALQCTNTATANAGTNLDGTATGLTTALATNTTYTFSVYVKSSALMSTLEIGRADVSGTDIACLTAQTVTPGGWTRFSCTFTTGGTLTSPYVYIKQTDATARTLYLDAALLETDTNASTNYRDGKISLGQGTITSQMLFQTANNSSTAFQIQNANGTQIFNVDTTDTNLISNPGFEANSIGWSAQGTNTTIRRDTSQTYLGLASLKVTQVTSTSANSGAQFSLNPVVTTASTTYTVSFYAKLDSGSAAFTDLNVRYSPDGTATSDCSVTAINNATVVTTGWTRYYCAVSSATAPTTSGFIRIMSTGTTIHTYYIDGVQMEATTVANMTAYGAGAFSFNGIITSPVTMRNPSDSTDAFKVQNAASLSLFTVDTLNSRVYVGSPTADATGTSLVLDTKNTSGDPTGVDGAMYYNSSSKAFRCFQNTVWKDCGPGIAANTTVTTFSNTTTETAMNNTYTIPADDCQPGRVYRITARGIYGIASAVTGTTLTMRVKFGATTIGSNASTATLNSSAQTNMPWELQYNITCLTTGAAGTVEGQGMFTFYSGTSGTTANPRPMFNTGTITINTTTTNVFQLTGQFGTLSASNTMSGRQLIMERLGP